MDVSINAGPPLPTFLRLTTNTLSITFSSSHLPFPFYSNRSLSHFPPARNTMATDSTVSFYATVHSNGRHQDLFDLGILGAD